MSEKGFFGGAGMNDFDTRPGNDFFPSFTRGEMMDRRRRTADMMKEQGLDALVIYGGFGVLFGSGGGQTNLTWLANYAACIQGYLVVARDGTLTLILRIAHHIENARDLTFIDDIRASYSVADGVAERLRELGAEKGRVGIVGPHVGRPTTRITIPVEHHQIITGALPGATLVDASDAFEAIRYVRTKEELNLLRDSGKLCDVVFKEMVEVTRPGITGTDLRRLVNIRCAEAGGTYVFCHIGSFPTANQHECYPDYYPNDRKVNAGDILYTELCLGYGTYWGKIWGTWFCGQPPAEYARMFQDAALAHDALLKEFKAGTRAQDYDRFAVALRDKGYELRYPLISGWSAINHNPQAGGVPDTKSGALVKPFHDWEFRAGETFTVVVWIAQPGTEKGVWVGTSGAVTETGFERFNDSFPAKLQVSRGK
jgi:Xaa-Pro dipeptidase